MVNGLKIVPKSIELKDERRRYRIDVTYPQIEGSNDRALLNLNRRIERLVAEHYRWPMAPATKEDLRYYEKWPGVYNSVDLDYTLVLATPKLLSIYFEVYSYGIGAAHSVEESFTINYDFEARRYLKLSHLFRPGAEYLRFISERCSRELSKHHEEPMLDGEKLAARGDNFQKWNITEKAIRVTFNACEIYSCAAGKRTVEIPLADLKHLLKNAYDASG